MDAINRRLLRVLSRATAFSLLVYTEQPLPTRLFLKKSRTSLNSTVQSRSENALTDRSNMPGIVCVFFQGHRHL